MPRTKKTAAAPPPPPPANSMVASAARIVAKRKDRPLGNGPQEWQTEAWGFFDTCGELAAATQWTANAMSQVKLRLVEELPDGSRREVPDNATGMGRFAADAMAALFDGDTGQAQMMAAFGTHLSIPGECYLVGRAPSPLDGEHGRDRWLVVSNEELRERSSGSGRWELDRGDGNVEVLEVAQPGADAPMTNESLIIRVWRPHPRKYVQATSPVRAALPVLRELEGLDKHTASTIDSRLAGAGILLVPSEMTFQTPSVDGQPPTDAEIDDFLSALADAMSAALQDPGSAAARVPIVVKAPGQFLDSVKHITFGTELDDRVSTLREGGVRRLALTIDMPPEELLGKGDVNHWGAWLISEDAIKIHIDPLADLVAEAIQTRYLWPAMQGASPTMDPAIKRFILEADTSDLRQRSLDFGQTMALHEQMLISDAAMLRESRFDPGDAPTDEEKRRRFTELVAKGGASPDTVQGAISIVTNGAVVPMPSTDPSSLESGSVPGEVVPPPTAAPAPLPAPAQEAPRTPPSPAGPAVPAAAAVEACASLIAARAVERAWNRVGKRSSTRRPVTDAQAVEAALADAWGQVPETAASLGVDPGRLEAALNRYATGLLVSGAAHDPAILARVIREQVLTPVLEAV